MLDKGNVLLPYINKMPYVWQEGTHMKHKEIAVVLSQESIGAGIYSMWLKCPLVASDAKEGQFISLYCHDGCVDALYTRNVFGRNVFSDNCIR